MTNTTYGSITITNVSDGQTFYTWYIYADDAEGTNSTLTPDNKEYMGVAANQATPLESLDQITDYGIFSWSQISIKVINQIEQYYKTSSSNTPSSSNSDWLDEEAWTTTMPNPWKDSNGIKYDTKYYVWKRQKTFWSNDTVTYVGLQLLSDYEVATALAKNAGKSIGEWCDEEGVTIIHGATIMTGTVAAAQIAADAITAEKLSTDAITSRNYYVKNDEGEYVKDEDGQLIWSEKGSQLNLADGTWHSKNFKIDEEGKITATSGSFTGHVEATSGSFANKGNLNLITKDNIAQSQITVTDKYPLYEISKSANYGGTIVSLNHLTIGATYTLSYKFKKTSGTLKSIGGHLAALTNVKCFVDGRDISAFYGADYGAEFVDDINEHTVVLTFTVGENALTYIQPNRGYYDVIHYDLWAIKVEEGTEATGSYSWEFTPDKGMYMWDGFSEDPVLKVDANGLEIKGNGEFTGKITAESGKIAGWDINNDNNGYGPSITYGTLGQPGSFHMYSNDKGVPGKILNKEITNSDILFGTKGWSLGIGENFGVTANGELYAYRGNIAGINVSVDNLTWIENGEVISLLSGTLSQKDEREVGQSGKRRDWFLWTKGRFGVDAEGKLYATGADISGKITAESGKIGGWSIENGGASSKNNILVNRSDGTTNGTSTGMASLDGTDFVAFWAGCPESLTPWEYNKTGRDYASVTPFFVTSKGYLHAASGDIAGWDITNTMFLGPKTDNRESSRKVGITSLPTAPGFAFWAGQQTGDGKNNAYGYDAPFRVDHAGNLTANSGSIAGWEIDTNHLGTLGTSLGSSGGIHLYPNGTADSTDTHFGSSGTKRWMLGIGSNFGVTDDGVLYANAGQIGGVEIGDIASIKHTGGINLLANSNKEVISPGTWTTFADLAPIFNEYGLVEYTISFDIKSNDPTGYGYIQVYCHNGNDYYHEIGTSSVPVTTEYTRQSVTVTPKIANVGDNKGVSNLAFYGYGGENYPRVKNVKVELGGKATPWCPAIEDQLVANVNTNNYSWKFSPTEGMFMWNGPQGNGAIEGEIVNGQTITKDTEDQNLVFKIDNEQVYMRGNGRFSGEIYAEKGIFKGDLVNETVENQTQFWWRFYPGSGITFWNSNPNDSQNSAVFSINTNGVLMRDLNIDTLRCNSIATGGTTALEIGYSEEGEEAVKKTISAQTAGKYLQVIFSLDKEATKETSMVVGLTYWYKDAVEYDFNEFYTLTISPGKTYVSAVYPYEKDAKAFLVTRTYKITSIVLVTEGMDPVETYWTAVNNQSRTYEVTTMQPSSGQLQLLTSGHFLPLTNPTETSQGFVGQNIGDDWHFWAQVYAKNGSINTSDRNLKRNIYTPTNQYELLYDSLRPVTYQFLEGMGDRVHNGFIAQEVKASLEAAGLTTQQLSAYCEWENSDGTTGCGLRYTEFIPLNTWQIQKLKPRVSSLEQTILEYETRISNLENQLKNLTSQQISDII